ncbi:MAG TPA: hypothetical protein VGC93_01190 [Thermoanaerobaculia bacterium]
MSEESARAETNRLLELLLTVVRISGVPLNEIERRMDLASGYLSKLWGRSLTFKIGHLFQILEVIQLDPVEFFRLAYPQEVPQPSPTGQKVRDLATKLQGSVPRQQPPAFTPEQLDMALGKLRELLTAQAAAAGGAREPDRARRR